MTAAVEHLLRTEAPQVLGALVRRFGHFDIAEDAVQEALLAASRAWPADGVPADPRSWLIRIGYRKMVDLLRSDQARRRREQEVGIAELALQDPARQAARQETDDSLTLLLLCCHPALSPTSQVALTLRAVGGLTTAEIAHAYGTTEATMGTRISRAKQQLARAGARFTPPTDHDRDSRVAAVMQMLYLIFNEGYTASTGDELARVDLTAEAIRLTRMLSDRLSDDAEATGLLAPMLLTESRRTARTDWHDQLVPLEEQDRTQWNPDLIREGTDLIDTVWRRGEVGPYQLQAAIGAVHAAAASAEQTDWPQIAALYLAGTVHPDLPAAAEPRGRGSPRVRAGSWAGTPGRPQRTARPGSGTAEATTRTPSARPPAGDDRRHRHCGAAVPRGSRLDRQPGRAEIPARQGPRPQLTGPRTTELSPCRRHRWRRDGDRSQR